MLGAFPLIIPNDPVMKMKIEEKALNLLRKDWMKRELQISNLSLLKYRNYLSIFRFDEFFHFAKFSCLLFQFDVYGFPSDELRNPLSLCSLSGPKLLPGPPVQRRTPAAPSEAVSLLPVSTFNGCTQYWSLLIFLPEIKFVIFIES